MQVGGGWNRKQTGVRNRERKACRCNMNNNPTIHQISVRTTATTITFPSSLFLILDHHHHLVNQNFREIGLIIHLCTFKVTMHW
jgi:hypothetical protein